MTLGLILLGIGFIVEMAALVWQYIYIFLVLRARTSDHSEESEEKDKRELKKVLRIAAIAFAGGLVAIIGVIQMGYNIIHLASHAVH